MHPPRPPTNRPGILMVEYALTMILLGHEVKQQNGFIVAMISSRRGKYYAPRPYALWRGPKLRPFAKKLQAAGRGLVKSPEASSWKPVQHPGTATKSSNSYLTWMLFGPREVESVSSQTVAKSVRHQSRPLGMYARAGFEQKTNQQGSARESTVRYLEKDQIFKGTCLEAPCRRTGTKCSPQP